MLANMCKAPEYELRPPFLTRKMDGWIDGCVSLLQFRLAAFVLVMGSEAVNPLATGARQAVNGTGGRCKGLCAENQCHRNSIPTDVAYFRHKSL